MYASSSRDTRNMEVGNKRQASNSTDASNIMDKNNTKNPRLGPKNTTRQHECIKSTLIKKKRKFSSL